MKVFQPRSELGESEIKKGLKMYVVDGACSMGMATLQGGVYLTAFAIMPLSGIFQLSGKNPKKRSNMQIKKQ